MIAGLSLRLMVGNNGSDLSKSRRWSLFQHLPNYHNVLRQGRGRKCSARAKLIDIILDIGSCDRCHPFRREERQDVLIQLLIVLLRYALIAFASRNQRVLARGQMLSARMKRFGVRGAIKALSKTNRIIKFFAKAMASRRSSPQWSYALGVHPRTDALAKMETPESDRS